MKSLLRRHARRITGVTGAALVLTAMAMTLTGTANPSLPATPVAASSGVPTDGDAGGHVMPNGQVMAGAASMLDASPSAFPSASPGPSASPSALPFQALPIELGDADPQVATKDQVNTAIGLAIGAILLATVAAGLAAVAISKSPGDEDESPQQPSA